jgi:hypothetical protein
VRRCIEQALAEAAVQAQAQGEGAASLELLVTGHSLGGGLATLCAYDLLATTLRTGAAPNSGAAPSGSSPTPGRVTLTLLTFAAPHMFNAAFRSAMREMQAQRQISSLAVVVAGDVLPRLGALGLAVGVGRQLRISPASAAPLLLLDDTIYSDEARLDDTTCNGDEARAEPGAVAEVQAGATRAGPEAEVEGSGWWTRLTRTYRGIRRFARELDQHAHTSHALLLGGETTPTRHLSVPLSTPWPVPHPQERDGPED